MLPIGKLDVQKIGERHLIVLPRGMKLYRKTVGNPLEYRHNKTTFTTKVEDENLSRIVGVDSGNQYSAGTPDCASAETENRIPDAEMYEIQVIKPIERILDLDEICKEQGIEKSYLKKYPEGEEPLKELYGLFKEKGVRIHGVKYTSRQLPGGTCYAIFDTLGDLTEHLLAEKLASTK